MIQNKFLDKKQSPRVNHDDKQKKVYSSTNESKLTNTLEAHVASSDTSHIERSSTIEERQCVNTIYFNPTMISILKVTEENRNHEELGIDNYNKDTPIVRSFVEYKHLVALNNTTYTSDKSSRSSSNSDRDYYRERIKENKDNANDNVTMNNDINNINKDTYSTLHVAMWNNDMKSTTATLDKISFDKHFKAAKENTREQEIR